MTISVDTLIALIALGVAVWSLAYTYHTNWPRLEVTGQYKNHDEAVPYYKVWVRNTGGKSVKITDFALLKDGKRLKASKFEPEEFTTETVGMMHMPVPRINLQLNEPFEHSKILTPNKDTYFGYYLRDVPDQILIKADSRISGLKHTLLIPTDFDE